MKRIVALSLLTLFTISIAKAQFSIGPRAGLSTNWTSLDGTVDQITDGDAQYALNIGAFARFGGKKVYLQPEVIYTNTTSEIVIDGGGSFADQVIESKLDKFDIPVILGVKPISFLSLQAGPVASLVVNKDDGLGSNVNNAVKDYKDFTFGIQAGAGLELGSLLVDVRYEGNLTNLGETRIAGLTIDERTPQLKGLIGFKLF